MQKQEDIFDLRNISPREILKITQHYHSKPDGEQNKNSTGSFKTMLKEEDLNAHTLTSSQLLQMKLEV